jgi:Protein of unknown function (DUF3618)
MDEDARAAGTPVESGEPRSPEQIRADIEQTREQVGDTVEALAAKTDVKARARDRMEELKGEVRARAGQVKTQAQGATPASAQEGGQKVVEVVRGNPAPFVLGGAVLVAFLLGRRSGRP